MLGTSVLTAYNGTWYGSGWYYPPFFLFLWPLFIGLFILAWIFFWRFRRSYWNRCGPYGLSRTHGWNPEEVIRMRLAKGEISAEEYEALLQRLERGRT